MADIGPVEKLLEQFALTIRVAEQAASIVRGLGRVSEDITTLFDLDRDGHPELLTALKGIEQSIMGMSSYAAFAEARQNVAGEKFSEEIDEAEEADD